MKKFLQKLKLLDIFTTNLKLSKKDFVENLSAITEDGSVGFFTNLFESFSADKYEYIGQVNFDGFKLRKRMRFFNNYHNVAVARGAIKENEGQLTIETEVNGFSSYMVFFYTLFTIGYSIMLIAIISAYPQDSFGLLILIGFGILMIITTCFGMKRSVRRLKYDLEREFFYLTRETT